MILLGNSGWRKEVQNAQPPRRNQQQQEGTATPTYR